MELLSACTHCGHSAFTPHLSAKDYTVSQETFQLVACGHCGLILTNPRPSATEIGPYYESPDYISHTNSSKGLTDGLYQLVRNRALKRKVALIDRYAPKGPLLDIGCGTGEFLGAAQAAGRSVQGIEPSDSARALAITNHNVPVLPEDGLRTLPSAGYAAVSMWHVLEHVHALNERLTELRRLVMPGGALFIAVPNPESWDAKHYASHWAAYDVPRHVNHFRPATLRNMVQGAGFTPLATLPMPFDAYYISLLSEKYKAGNTGSHLLKGFLMGRKSNAYAKAHADAWSSQLYIFQG